MSFRTHCSIGVGAIASIAVFVNLSLVLPVHAMCASSPVAVDDEIHPTASQLLVLIDPVANDSDPQGLPLALTVDSSTCPGSAVAEDGLISLTLSAQLNSTCQITYSIDNGEATATSATVTIHPSTGIFSDGFELGNTSAWSGS